MIIDSESTCLFTFTTSNDDDKLCQVIIDDRIFWHILVTQMILNSTMTTFASTKSYLIVPNLINKHITPSVKGTINLFL